MNKAIAGLVCVLIAGCAGNEDNTTVLPVVETKPELVTYGSFVDKMEGTETRWVGLRSSNSVDFSFPHDKNTTATLRVGENNNVVLELSSGQVLCNSYDGCSIKVKFDDNKPVNVRVFEPSDGTYNLLIFCPDHVGDDYICRAGSFVKKLKASNKMLIQVEVYQEGNPVFEFDTSLYPKV